MHRMRDTIMLIGLAASLAACGSSEKQEATSETPSPPSATTPVATDTGDAADSSPAASRPAAFAVCMSCHSTEAGKNGVGPSLAGVFGAKSGHVSSYSYSPAMQAANLTWDEPTLDKYLTAPMKMVPGTRMAFAGLSDPQQRKDVIAYLKGL